MASLISRGADNSTQIWFMNGAQINRRINVVDEHGAPIFIGPPWTIAAAAFVGPWHFPYITVKVWP